MDGSEGDAFVARINELALDIIVDVVWVGAFGNPELASAATIEAIEAGAESDPVNFWKATIYPH